MALLLLLGASSLVGGAAAPLLVRSGYAVHGVGRGAAPTDFPRAAQWHTADLNSRQDVQSLPRCDVIVSLLPVWLAPSALIALRGETAQRIVVFSSTSILTKPDSPDVSERSLAKRLDQGESGVRQLSSGPRTTIVRPTLIYGGASDGNVARISAIIRRTGVFPLVGEGCGLRQPVHANDLAAAIPMILDHPRAAGETYELAGGEILTYRAMVLRIAKANDLSVRFVRIPSRLTRVGARVASAIPGLPTVSPEALTRMNKDMTFDSSRARRDFDYAPGAFRP